jgi:hypothetical protein
LQSESIFFEIPALLVLPFVAACASFNGKVVEEVPFYRSQRVRITTDISKMRTAKIAAIMSKPVLKPELPLPAPLPLSLLARKFVTVMGVSALGGGAAVGNVPGVVFTLAAVGYVGGFTGGWYGCVGTGVGCPRLVAVGVSDGGCVGVGVGGCVGVGFGVFVGLGVGVGAFVGVAVGVGLGFVVSVTGNVTVTVGNASAVRGVA